MSCLRRMCSSIWGSSTNWSSKHEGCCVRSGFFAFSVESLDALAGDAAALPDRRDYKLNVTARYAHSMAYLTRMAADYGFDVLSTTGTQHRLDKGKPVQGYLTLWRRPPN